MRYSSFSMFVFVFYNVFYCSVVIGRSKNPLECKSNTSLIIQPTSLYFLTLLYDENKGYSEFKSMSYNMNMNMNVRKLSLNSVKPRITMKYIIINLLYELQKARTYITKKLFHILVGIICRKANKNMHKMG